MSGENRPDYVAGLRLNRAPFETDSDEAFFFADPALTERLEELQHLTEVGGKVLVIEGVAGSGRTTLLQQLVRRAGDGWTVCRMQGADLAEPTAVLRQVARQYGLDETARPDDLRRLVANYCQVTSQSLQLPVLIIDDADRVPHMVMEQVLNLCGTPAETVQYFRIVLSGLPGLQESLVDAGFADNDPSLIRTLVMPPLAEAQTDAYLMYRLSVAGYSGASPFSPLELRAIQESAAGLRGRVNQLAHQALLQHLWALPALGRGAAELAGDRPLRLRGSSRQTRWVGAGVAAAVAAGIFGWRLLSPTGDAPSPAGVVTQKLALPPAKTASSQQQVADGGRAPDLSAAASLAAFDGHDEAADTAGERPPLPPLPAIPGVSTGSSDNAHVPHPESEGSFAAMVVPDAGNWGNSLSASAAVEAPPEVPHREADAGEQGATDSPVPVTEAQPKADESGVYREDWLGTQSPDAVTLQLVAVSRESSLRRFLNQHQLSAPTAYFHTQRNGKDWYVVVHGVYSDRTAAQAAIPALPEAIRQGRPWPRTFASVQTDIQAEAAP